MAVKKSQMITLVLCSDRDFKYRAINFMNNIAFQAEKISVETIVEAKNLITSNERVLNLIIDGSVFGKEINTVFEQIKDLVRNPDLMALLYLSEEQTRAFSHRDHGCKNLIVKTLPFAKPDFNDAFHSRGGKQVDTSVFGIARKVSAADANGAAAPQQAAPKKSVTAFEASQHVRETVNLLNELVKDKTKLDVLQEVGQRFNGIMGTFAFLESKVGMSELKRLSLCIDGIARTYEDNNETEIKSEHFELLMKAAKTAYMILMKLRENPGALPEELIKAEQDVKQVFESDSDIKKRDSHTQNDVDQILEKYNI